MRALVLAAGLGTRLRPLTETSPKPLLPVGGKPLIAHTLDRLVTVGCEAAAINLHYRGDQIRDALGASYAGMPLLYSPEDPILGTLGALDPLRDFFSEADTLLVVNGDSLCEWPFEALLAAHQKGTARATLHFTSWPDPERFGGGEGLLGDRVVSLRRAGIEIAPPSSHLVFAGAHALHPSLLAEVPAEPADFVLDLYGPMLLRGEPVGAFRTDHAWHDIGTPVRYHEALMWRCRRTSCVATGAKIAASARLEESCVENAAMIEPGARLFRTAVLPGARIGAGCELVDCLVGFDVQVPAGSQREGRFLASSAAGPVDQAMVSLLR